MQKNTFRSLALLGVLAACFNTSKVFAIDIAVQDIEFGKNFKSPWFTGSLLSPGGYTVPQGHYNIQPYFYYTYFDKAYNKNWNTYEVQSLAASTLIIPFKMGLGKGWDFGVTPGFVGKYRDNQKYYGLTDWVVGFNYQLLRAELEDPYPGIKLILKAVIPLGKYQHLNPKKLRTDITGDGSFWPTIGLGASKLWHVYKNHFFELRGGIVYFISTPVRVKGYNTYGGAKNTKATVYNGNVTTYNIAAQYNLSQNWGVSVDFLYKHKNKTRYKGFAGTNNLGEKLTLKAPSNENFSVAPALEYNFSANLGLIGGVWFSFKGRNSFDFTSGVLSLNIYI